MDKDTIYRQDAIDTIKNTYGLSYIEDGFNRQDAVSILENLPSAEPERKTGKWIAAKYPFSKCSICERYFDTANNIGNFCPICGSYNGGEQE